MLLVVAFTECLEYGLINSSDDAILSLFENVCSGSEEFQEIDREVKRCNTVGFLHIVYCIELLPYCDGVVMQSFQSQASLALSPSC